jgi:tryptophan synthase alpha chain
MSNIARAFSGGKAFIAFLTGGDPSLEKSLEYIQAIAEAGADLIEIGIPFSDPIAEGLVISEANIRALKAGTTVEKIFSLVREARKITDIPVVFLTYLNPVFHRGYDVFFRECGEAGMDGIIIPDLPFEEQEEVSGFSSKHGINLVSLIAPTSQARIKEIARNAEGFIYLVSSMGVTGVRSEITTDLDGMIAAVRQVTKTPVAVGFGIHSPEQARDISRKADGVIVGSAIVRIIAEHGGSAGKAVFDYVKKMKEAVSG